MIVSNSLYAGKTKHPYSSLGKNGSMAVHTIQIYHSLILAPYLLIISQFLTSMVKVVLVLFIR